MTDAEKIEALKFKIMELEGFTERAEARAEKAEAERDALKELTGALRVSRMTWMDMYNGMGMLPERRKAMEDGSHEVERALDAARARLAMVEERESSDSTDK